MAEQTLEHKSFEKPDEVREGENWRMELLTSPVAHRSAGSLSSQAGNGRRT
jgi:hypothetical protein